MLLRPRTKLAFTSYRVCGLLTDSCNISAALLCEQRASTLWNSKHITGCIMTKEAVAIRRHSKHITGCIMWEAVVFLRHSKHITSCTAVSENLEYRYRRQIRHLHIMLHQYDKMQLMWLYTLNITPSLLLSIDIENIILVAKWKKVWFWYQSFNRRNSLSPDEGIKLKLLRNAIVPGPLPSLVFPNPTHSPLYDTIRIKYVVSRYTSIFHGTRIAPCPHKE